MKEKMKKLLAFIMTGVTVIGTSLITSMTAVSCVKEKEQVSMAKVISKDETVQISAQESCGIALVKTVLTAEEYAEYGVSPTAETAYTLTATVTPANASNQALDWSIAWVNEGNGWVSGKEVTDYVTVVPVTTGGKTATVTCLQGFGEQIKITVKAKSDESKFAMCTVDYTQKLEFVKLDFGSVPIMLGDVTEVQYEIAEGVQGPGGQVVAKIKASDVYTLTENFTYSVTLSSYAEYVGTGNIFSLKGSSITGAGNFSINTEYYGKSIYFDYDHDIKNWFIMNRSGDILFKNLTVEERAEYFSEITKPGLYQVNFTITGKYNVYSYTSQVKCVGYTNNTAVSSVSLDRVSYVF